MAVTNNYSIQQPTVGGDTNLWGGYLNNGALAVIDAALGSSLAVSISSADVNLTAAQFQNAVFICSGALTANRNLVVPLSPNSATLACGGCFVVVNNCTGNFTLTIKTAATGSTGVVVPKGYTAFLYSDTTNVGYCTLGLPGFAKAVNGNPNGQLAGTAGSATTNAQLAFDFTNFTLYICTVTGDATTAVWSSSVSGSIPLAMQGYLTPTSSTPIIGTDASAVSTLYYTPFIGSWAAYHNGSQIVPFRFSQMLLALSTAQAANNVYDVFLAYNSGTPVIGTGPTWAAGSGGSVTPGSCVRGTGAGGTTLTRDTNSGLLVNTVQISLTWNTGGGNTTLTVAAGQAVYLGTIAIGSAAGQITCHRSYGQSRRWDVYNAYNQQPVILKVGDPAASWGLGLQAAYAPANGSTANSASICAGLAYNQVVAVYDQKRAASTTTLTICGIGWNSTSTPSGMLNEASGLSGFFYFTGARYVAPPALGTQVITCLTSNPFGNTVTFYGTESGMLMTVEFMA